MRLTKKFKTASGFKYGFVSNSHLNNLSLERGVGVLGLASRKLGQHEDIEDEKGLPLPVYIKLLESEFLGTGEVEVYVIYNEDDGNIEKYHKEINKRFIVSVDFENKTIDVQGWQKWAKNIPFSEYGTTWALRREELK